MKFKRMFSTIDTHSGGQPTRTVIGGIPYIPGKTINDKVQYLKENEDWIRKILVNEPRGNSIMSGVILTEPCTPGADIGFIFIEAGGYLPMCGHDIIGACTALVETGIIKPVEPYTHIKIDTPAGTIKAKVKVENNSAKEVAFTNIPSFVFAQSLVFYVPSIGTITADIAYGGCYHAIIQAEELGLKIKPEESSHITYLANLIKDSINERIKVTHPEKPYVNEITHICFSAPASNPKAHLKNAVVVEPSGIDRSPSGTGSSANMASLYMKGELKIGEDFIHESIIGTLYKCRILEETKVKDIPAVITEITSSAYVTGMHTFFIDPDDPIQDGFYIGQ